MKQGSSEWLELRKTKVTATDIAIILGESPYTTAYDLWRRKLGLLPPVEVTPAMERGRDLEDEAREFYNEITRLNCQPEVVFHAELNFLMASLDGIDREENRQVEIKCGSAQYLAATSGREASDIYWQVQCQLACTGNEESDLLFYQNRDRFKLITVQRNNEHIQMLEKAGREFYYRLVEFDPPPAKHRKREDKEMQEAVDTYRLAKDMLARAEENEKEARGKLMALSGGECIEGYGLKVTHYAQRGAVDYGSIPALQGIDLDIYRKPPVIRSRITL